MPWFLESVFSVHVFWCMTQVFTNRIRSTREGYVLTRVCPSICLSVCPHLVGGTPARSRWGVPQPGPGKVIPCSGVPHLSRVPPAWTWHGGVPHLGYPLPHQTWLGVPLLGVPHLRPPQSDLAKGVPLPGEVPHLGYTSPPMRPGGQVPMPGWYPTSGNRWSTWYAAVGMRSRRRTFL